MHNCLGLSMLISYMYCSWVLTFFFFSFYYPACPVLSIKQQNPTTIYVSTNQPIRIKSSLNVMLSMSLLKEWALGLWHEVYQHGNQKLPERGDQTSGECRCFIRWGAAWLSHKYISIIYIHQWKLPLADTLQISKKPINTPMLAFSNTEWSSLDATIYMASVIAVSLQASLILQITIIMVIWQSLELLLMMGYHGHRR